GGEGTVDALVQATGGQLVEASVHDPLMRPINAFFGISGDGKTAFIEMAAASGLTLLDSSERNPMRTISFGTGELIRCALDKGCREIILGIGGSATVDGGVGMAQAIGVRFTDASGKETEHHGRSLGKIAHINLEHLDSRISQCRIRAACDVTNPVTGPQGAAFVYGPQKGANSSEVKELDNNLLHLSQLIRNTLHIDITSIPGGGAAGGMGAGIVAFLNGELMPGFDLVSRVIRLEEWIEWADLVITGEGSMDAQTAFGKTPSGVARMAKAAGKHVVAFTGAIGSLPEELQNMGFDAVIPIADKPMTLARSLKDAGVLLENACARSFSLMKLGKELLQ
ncbi:MAG: glycerate kinase, partial [Bacteroidales bacterium]|nr:glycerate kinase [Bacteroidales bacterium]